ncbi:hypothetical protein EJF36_20175 [Bacillus sp. HMF5848]|uniref:hypothetical protein n=1 Tax=Bacillus sp. HMF5848 TaxID=2495421 RepID=UPI000F7B6214|nr:hypothetical protein [Bacillus sp. HMF5848]RSK29011.1 hypothetical protein EJF36_20175 [Bacillus sp. HMF5848]
MSRCVNPIVCPTQYRVRDTFVRRPIPVIHPIVDVNRVNVVNVPRHIVQRYNQTVVVDPGVPRGPRFF